MNRQVATITLLFMIAVICTVVYLVMLPPTSDGLAKVYMLDVGQGDSFLIQAANGRQILIDGGKNEKALVSLSKVMPRGDRTIDVVLATHPDADHIGGLPLILKRYKVGLFLTSGVQTDTEQYATLFNTLREQNTPAYYVRKGMTLSLDSQLKTDFSIIFPDRSTSNWETNTASVIGRLQVKDRSMLFTGDSPTSVEDAIAKRYPLAVDVDILKLAHHGSKTSTSESFLKAVTPRLALISAGINNSYGHPAPVVTDRLKALGIPTISTQKEGTVTLETDGLKWFKE